MRTLITKLSIGNKTYFALFAFAFCFLFRENFVLSEAWSILTLREIDDYALQGTLRQIHQHLDRGELSYLVANFSYGYGTLFWFTYGVLLYPFYLLGCTQGLIVGAREISLFFCTGSIAFLIAIARIYTRDKSLAYGVGLLAILCPAIPYAANRFHVNSQVPFYCMASLYFLLRRSVPQQKDFLLSAVFLGMGIGSKLVSLYLLPVVALISLERLFFRAERPACPWKVIVMTLGTLIVVSLLALYPPILVSPFIKTNTRGLWEGLKFFITYSKVNDLGPKSFEDPWYLLKAGFAYFYIALPIFVVMLCLWVIRIRNDINEKKFDFLILFVSLIALLFYVLFSLKKGPSYFGQYFLPVGMLFCLGLLTLERFKHRAVYLVLLICLGQFLLNRSALRATYAVSSSFLATEEGQGQWEAYHAIRKLAEPRPEKLYFLRTYAAVIPFSIFDPGIRDVVMGAATFLEKECAAEITDTPDYISFLEKNRYTEELVNSYAIDNARHRAAMERIEKFIRNPTCGVDHYEAIYKKNSLYFYKKIKK